MPESDPRNWTNEELSVFILENERLIYSVAKNYTESGIGDIDDCYQIACIGVIKGVQKYDQARGVKLTSYLHDCMVNELNMEVRKLTADKRKATLVSLEDYTNHEKNSQVYMDKKFEDINDIQTEEPTPHEHAEREEIRAVVRNAIANCLTPEERYVMRELIYKERSQMDIAGEMDVSQSKISAVYNMSCSKIALEIHKHGFTEFDFGGMNKKKRTRAKKEALDII